MPIKLPTTVQKTREELHQEYVDSHRALTDKLVQAIADICAHHRQTYEAALLAAEEQRLDRFLNGRGPNQTAEEFYRALWGDRYSASGDGSRAVEAEVRFVNSLTNHPTWTYRRERDFTDDYDFTDYSAYVTWAKDKNRPSFPVDKREDCEEILRLRIKQHVDRIIEQFCLKVRSKLTDIIVVHTDYDCKLKHGSFAPGMFEGDVLLSFKSGVSFRLHVIVKTNCSVLGNLYTQYPLTFHEVVSAPGKKPIAMLSEEQVHEAMKIVAWKPPPPQRKPWTTVGVGDIVECKDKRLALVVATRGEKATVFHPQHGEWSVTAPDVALVHARTAYRHRYHPKPRCFVEVKMNNGNTAEFDLPHEEAERVERSSWGERDRAARKVMLPTILAKWDQLKKTPGT